MNIILQGSGNELCNLPRMDIHT